MRYIQPHLPVVLLEPGRDDRVHKWGGAVLHCTFRRFNNQILRLGWKALFLLVIFTGCSSVNHETTGDEHWAQGDYKKALVCYRRAMAEEVSPRIKKKIDDTVDRLVSIHAEQATVALEDDKFKEAIRIARKGQEFRPDGRLKAIVKDAKRRYVANEIMFGRLHLDLGEYPKAIKHFKAALEYDNSPENNKLVFEAKSKAAESLAQKAKSLVVKQKFDEAIEMIDRALELHEIPK